MDIAPTFNSFLILFKNYTISPLRCGLVAGAIGLGGPFAISALGFGAGGIVPGSIAAKMMSLSAIWNGGGVPAGGLVAFLQSLGTNGLTAFATSSFGQALIMAGCLIEL